MGSNANFTPPEAPAAAPALIPPSRTTTITYTYDNLYRLTAADYSDGRYFNYAYDATGNRLTQETDLLTNNYVYDSANRLTSVDGVTYSYDNNGNLLSDGASTNTYNHANRLTSVTQGGISYNFVYNGLGDRLQQTVDTVTTNYTLDLNTGLTQVLTDGTDTYLYGLGRIGEYDSANWTYPLTDALGSVRQLTDASGAPVMAQNYAPYGDVLESYGDASSNYGFAGEWTDGTGLQHLRARYLNTGIGRFITRDTWGGDYNRPMSLNRWGYVEGNPVNRVDPSGMCPESLKYGEYANYEYCLEYKQIQETFDALGDFLRPVMVGNYPLEGATWSWKPDARKRGNVTQKPPGISWGPSMLIDDASQIQSYKHFNQYYVDVNGDGVISEIEKEVRGYFGYNLCGQIALSAIIETLTGSTQTLNEILNINQDRGGTDAHGLGKILETLNVNYGLGINYWVHQDSVHYKLKMVGKNFQTIEYEKSNRPTGRYTMALPMWYMQLIANKHYYIAAVDYDKDQNAILIPITKRLNKWHWVVITGFSSQWDYSNINSRYNWVKIYNPFKDREEYYWWREFYNALYINSGLEVW